MSISSWPSTLKARVGQRSMNIIQIMLIVSLGSIVLLRDSLRVGIDISLNADSRVEADVVETTSVGKNEISGPKRNIASVEERNGRELESVPDPTDPTDFSHEQPLEWTLKKRGSEVKLDDLTVEEVPTTSVSDDEQIVDDNNSVEEPTTEFDQARQKRGKPRGKNVSKDLKVEVDPTAEVKVVDHMFLTSDKTPREFTIPEDLQDPELKEPVKEMKAKRTKKHKKQPTKEENLELKDEEHKVFVDNADSEQLTGDSTGEQPEDVAIQEVVEGQEEPFTSAQAVDSKPPVKEPEFSGEPFSFGKSPKNWDQQRFGWLERYPWMKATPNGKPRVLLITGSSPWACRNPVGDHMQLKSLKNKIDYARQHDMELFYNVAHLERNLTSYWAKLPIIRQLMLTHPEIEWFFWVDADAMFTDMLFELPIEKYDGYNIVMWGWEENLYKNRSWVAINDGAFLFRNCQWSLDLIDMWAPMGPEGDVRKKWGEFFSYYMSERPQDFPADDQSALVYLILTKPELQTKIKLEWDYELSGYWELFVNKFEEFMTTPGNHPGLGGKTWPYITHFTGCQPCSGNHNPKYSAEECALQMDRAYHFADNQVLQRMGFMHENLNSPHLKKIEEESEEHEYNIIESIGPNTWTSASESYGL